MAAFGVYLVLLGLLVGSFLNLAIDRLPRAESLIRPRSHCRACGRVLNVIDLLPVAGYLVRRGRCATCAVPIGLGSPLVEAGCGACVLVSIAWFGLWPGSLIAALLIAWFGMTAVGLAVRRRTARETDI